MSVVRPDVVLWIFGNRGSAVLSKRSVQQNLSIFLDPVWLERLLFSKRRERVADQWTTDPASSCYKALRRYKKYHWNDSGARAKAFNACTNVNWLFWLLLSAVLFIAKRLG